METIYHIHYLLPFLILFITNPLIIMALWSFFYNCFKTLIIFFYNKMHSSSLIISKTESDFFVLCLSGDLYINDAHINDAYDRKVFQFGNVLNRDQIVQPSKILETFFFFFKYYPNINLIVNLKILFFYFKYKINVIL